MPKTLLAIQASKVQMADRPPNLGGSVHTLSKAEAEKKLGVTFEEGIFADEKTTSNPEYKKSVQAVQKFISQSDPPPAALVGQVKKLLKQPREDLAICFMDQKVGYGVFATANIPKGSALCIYSGTLMLKQGNEQVDNGYSLDYPVANMGYPVANLKVSAESSRGIMAYIQHLPAEVNEEEFSIIKTKAASQEALFSAMEAHLIKSRMRDNLATANTCVRGIILDGLPIAVLISNRVIRAGEQVGFSYECLYWAGKGCYPEYFDKSGRILPHDSYTRTAGCLKLGNFRYVGHFSPLIDLLKQEAEEINIPTETGEPYKISSAMLRSKLIEAVALKPGLESKSAALPLLAADSPLSSSAAAPSHRTATQAIMDCLPASVLRVESYQSNEPRNFYVKRGVAYICMQTGEAKSIAARLRSQGIVVNTNKLATGTEVLVIEDPSQNEQRICQALKNIYLEERQQDSQLSQAP